MDLEENEVPIFINKSFRGLYASLIGSPDWWLISGNNETAAGHYIKTALVPERIPALAD